MSCEKNRGETADPRQSRWPIIIYIIFFGGSIITPLTIVQCEQMGLTHRPDRGRRKLCNLIGFDSPANRNDLHHDEAECCHDDGQLGFSSSSLPA